jgi:hypothetical protein
MGKQMGETNNHFSTSNLNFAAYLYASGVFLKDIDFSQPRAEFIFDEPSKDLLTNYQSGEATVKVLVYDHAQNELKARLMRGQRNGNR